MFPKAGTNTEKQLKTPGHCEMSFFPPILFNSLRKSTCPSHLEYKNFKKDVDCHKLLWRSEKWVLEHFQVCSWYLIAHVNPTLASNNQNRWRADLVRWQQIQYILFPALETYDDI